MPRGRRMLPRAVPNPKPLSTGLSRRRSAPLPSPNWSAAPNPGGQRDLQADKAQDQALQDRLSALAQVRQGVKGACPKGRPEPNALARPRGLGRVQAVHLVPVATRSNSSASRSAEMAAATEVKVAVLQGEHAPQEAATAQPCPLACANRLHPASSCSSRNPQDVQVFPHRDGPTAPLSPREETVRKQLRLSRARRQRRHRRRLPQGVLEASGPEQGLEGSVAPDVPTGMTAPSWMRCATVRRRSSVKKSTSSGRTTIPWLHRPVDLPASSKTWCCRPAWRAHPSRNPSRRLHRNRWQRCASAVRKPRDNASGGVPWSCGQPVKPSRSGPK